jgi:hypothetical protein
LLKIGAVTLAPSTASGKSSGLTFHYPPYAVGAYALGDAETISVVGRCKNFRRCATKRR